MKTYYFLVCVLFALVFSCGKTDKPGKLLSKLANKDTIVDTTQVRIIKEYFSNGMVKTEVSALGSLREGPTRNYDRDGHLLSEVNYVNNIREGMATNYYPLTGKVNSTLVYKNGIKEDDEIWYYESGQKFRVSPFVKGRINGIQKFYYEDGKLLAEVPFKDGNPGVGLKEYKKDGSLITQYPKLIIQQKDYMSQANKVILDISLSDPYATVKFYRGSLKDGKYLHNDLLQLAAQHGITQVDFNVAPGSSISQKVIITANFKTPLGNPLILSRTFSMSAVNNN